MMRRNLLDAPSRQLSITGLEQLGFGGTATTFALSDTSLLKAYPKSYPAENVVREWRRAVGAYGLAVPTAEPLELVSLEEDDFGLGIVFERLSGMTLAQELMTGQTELESVAGRLGRFMRELHSIELRHHDFEDQREVFAHYALRLADKDFAVLERKEAKQLSKLYMTLPQTMSFLHGDLHAANVIDHTNQLTLIDMEGVGFGHPLLDWAGTWQALELIPSLDPDCCEKYVSLDATTARNLMKPLMQAYFGTSDEKRQSERLRAMEIFGIAKYACMIVRDPNPWIDRASVAQMLREQVLDHSDEFEYLISIF
ncbi:MAG: phosphotransferase [Atopobiaceae bacterium]|nr:phosphotransferase [Atopobiaceae bacterium]